MVPIHTMTTVSIRLGKELFIERADLLDKMFDERCDALDARLSGSLTEAFEGEKISKARIERIVNRFCGSILHKKEVE